MAQNNLNTLKYFHSYKTALDLEKTFCFLKRRKASFRIYIKRITQQLLLNARLNLCLAVLVLLTLIQRVRTFRDCPEAAAELRKQIEEAKSDLKSQGFKSE